VQGDFVSIRTELRWFISCSLLAAALLMATVVQLEKIFGLSGHPTTVAGLTAVALLWGTGLYAVLGLVRGLRYALRRS
jgi:hypothetical protein